MTPDFLRDVCELSAERARAGKRERSEEDLRAHVKRLPPVTSLRAALAQPGRRFIAEVKRVSPSKGPIRSDLDARGLARAYEDGGAAAVSVLTEPKWFAGSLEDLRAVRGAVSLPVLRKDFLVDPWQAWEARVNGADAGLLIVAALPGARLREMASALAEAGLEALVEVHTEEELDVALEAGFPVIGVNSRDLRTLAVDLEGVVRLVQRIPRGVVAVAESGVTGKTDIERLESAGYRAFLVGETLVRADLPRDLLLSWAKP